jgi:serine/threonine protein phosphatase PrpC
MGCTAEIMTFTEKGYVAGYLGDSRIYLLRNGKFTQITKDHSLVQEQINRGVITVAEAKKHPLRNIPLRAVGSNEPFNVDIIRGNIYRDDMFLLCSDGLTTMLDDIMIKHVLASPTPVSQKMEALIECQIMLAALTMGSVSILYFMPLLTQTHSDL